MIDICKIFFAFILYSVVGYVVEVLFCSVGKKKIYYQSGFLAGPWCPIYGTGAVLMYLLSVYKPHPEVVFIVSAFICTLVEYITSYLLEKIFKTRWWNYRDHKFNINGRVCLKNSLLFGIAGLVVVYFVKDFTSSLIDNIPSNLLIISTIILFILFVIDIIISVMITIKISKLNEMGRGDNTRKIKTQMIDEIENNYKFFRRVLNSFPNAFQNVRDVVREIKIKKKI